MEDHEFELNASDELIMRISGEFFTGYNALMDEYIEHGTMNGKPVLGNGEMSLGFSCTSDQRLSESLPFSTSPLDDLKNVEEADTAPPAENTIQDKTVDPLTMGMLLAEIQNRIDSCRHGVPYRHVCPKCLIMVTEA